MTEELDVVPPTQEHDDLARSLYNILAGPLTRAMHTWEVVAVMGALAGRMIGELPAEVRNRARACFISNFENNYDDRPEGPVN